MWEPHKNMILKGSQAVEAKEGSRSLGLQKGGRQFTGR